MSNPIEQSKEFAVSFLDEMKRRGYPLRGDDQTMNSLADMATDLLDALALAEDNNEELLSAMQRLGYQQAIADSKNALSVQNVLKINPGGSTNHPRLFWDSDCEQFFISIDDDTTCLVYGEKQGWAALQVAMLFEKMLSPQHRGKNVKRFLEKYRQGSKEENASFYKCFRKAANEWAHNLWGPQ